MKKIIQRHPRPLGTTNAITQLNSKQENEREKILRKIQGRIIQEYVVNDMRLNDVPISINKLAKYLNINPTIVMKGVQEQITRISGFMGTQDNTQNARVLKFRALKLGLDVVGIGTQQVEVLARAQGNKYVPFLSSALNQAIGNLTGIYKASLEHMRAETEAARPAAGINEDKEFGNTGTQYLTTDEALKILNETPSLLTDHEYLEAKKLEIGGLPDVCARNQDLSTIGIKLSKNILLPTLAPIPVIPTEHKVPNINIHTERDR